MRAYVLFPSFNVRSSSGGGAPPPLPLVGPPVEDSDKADDGGGELLNQTLGKSRSDRTVARHLPGEMDVGGRMERRCGGGV